MKSAYELALERLEKQGIDRPRVEGLDAATQDEIAAIRQTYDAKLAEIEILFRDHQKTQPEPEARREAEEKYRQEKRRLEERRDSKIAAARNRS